MRAVPMSTSAVTAHFTCRPTISCSCRRIRFFSQGSPAAALSELNRSIMANLKLGKLPDRTPSKITISVSAELNQALKDYARPMANRNQLPT